MIKGINQNTHPEANPSGYIYWAKNCIWNDKLDAGINEKGNLLTYATPFNFAARCGVTTINNKVITFYVSTAGEDCISIYDEFTSSLLVKVTRTDLNFDPAHPIKAVAKYNANNELVVAFVQDNNSPKYINLDTASISDSLNFYNLFPIISNPTDIIAEILDGGAVIGGAYYMTFAYIARDRTRTTYTTFSNPVYVTTIEETQLQGLQQNGNKAGASTNKSIKFTINNVDTTYSKISVAIIARIGGVVTQSIIKEVAISGSNLTFIYGGTESIGTVTLDELIADNIRYTSAKHITSLNDELFLADLAIGSVYDYQSLVNQTTVKWVSTLNFVGTVSRSSTFKDGNHKTFIHDEVSALYLQIELQDGTLTDWFHIPGRAPGAGETSNSGLSTGGLTINGRTPKVYEIEDTAILTDTLPTVMDQYGTTSVYGFKGQMGFWQNDNEVYPSTFRWGALGGQKVRHHKFPSIDFMASSVYTADGDYGIGNLDKLDIEITNSALFSRPEVKGYRLGYAKRSLADVGVAGMGLLQFAGAPEGGDNVIPSPVGGEHFDSKTLMSAGGNFWITPSGAGNDIYLNKSYLRFNSFDIWQDRPALNGVYLRNHLKLKATALEKNAPSYAGSSTYGIQAAISDTFYSYASNFTISGTGHTTKSASDIADKVRKLTDPFYVPNHSRVSKDSLTIKNLGYEETVIAKIEGTDLNINTYGQVTVSRFIPAVGDPNLAEEVYLSSLKNPKSDFFLGFESQTIISSSTLVRVLTPTTIVSFGDGFLGLHSYISLAATKADIDQNADEAHRIVNFKIHIGVSRHNVGMRYQIDGDYSTYFFPTSGLFTLSDVPTTYWFYDYSKKLPWNQFQYSKDYSSLNDFETFAIFIEGISNQSIFPYRIARSTKASRDNALDDGWKTFKAADYFDSVATKGEISNLQGWGNDSLLIHHRNALFRTRDKAVLQTDIISISLGSGDIFALEPKEEKATPEGVGGTQHSYSCKLTEIGYFYVDAEARRAFIFDGNELKDAGGGLRLFFKQYLGCTSNNPFVSTSGDQAIVSAYDQVNNRIILSQKAAQNSFVLTYDLVKGEWNSAHDYKFDYMFNTRKSLYSCVGIDQYTHNIGDRGNFYGVVYSTYVDFVVNDSPSQEKILEYIEFLVKVYNNGVVLPRKTVTYITVWNDQYCSNKISVVTNETNSIFKDSNTKVIDQSWYFDELLDQVADPNLPFVDTIFNDSRPIASNMKVPVWYDSEVLRGKYFIIRLEYDNIENKEVHLREVTPSFEPSK